jgi:WD40 repeat protein
VGRLSRIAALAAAAIVIVVSVSAYVVTRRQRDRAEQALAEKRQAQAGEAAAKEAKAIIEKAKIEVEQMKRREAYYSAIAQAARQIEGRQYAIAETLLREAPPELRHWEWGRLMHLCHPELLCIRARLPVAGQASMPAAVALSPDGLTILTAGDSVQQGDAWTQYDPVLWDAGSGQEIRQLVGHTGGVYTVALSAAGKYALTGGRAPPFDIKLWDPATGAALRTLSGHQGTVGDLAFSGDSALAVSASWGDKTVKVWDVATGSLVRDLPQATRVGAVAIAPDGRRLAIASDDGVRLWELDGGREAWIWKCLFVKHVAFSPDGTLLLVGGDGLTLRGARDGREVRAFTGHRGAVLYASFSPDGKRVMSGGNDSTARLWDADTGKELVVFTGHGGPVGYCRLFPDGKRVLTAGMDETVRIWDVRGHAEALALPAAAAAAAFTPDGNRIITVGSHTMVWDAQTGQVLKQSGLTPPARALALLPGGRRAVSSGVNYGDTSIRYWDLDECREVWSLDSGFGYFVYSLAVSPDGKHLGGSSGMGTAKVWDLESRQELCTVRRESAPCWWRAIAFGSDGRLLTGDGINDSSTGQCLLRWPELSDLDAVAFSADGTRLLTGHKDKTARLWDWQTHTELARLRGHANQLRAVAFSPDGRRLLTGGVDRTARLWDAETGREVFTLYADTIVSSVGFSPDGMRVMVGNDWADVKLLDAVDWRLSPEELEKAQVEGYQKWLGENGPAAAPAAGE